MADDVSRVKYSCSQNTEPSIDETNQLDFFFLYKIDAPVGTKVELNRLQAAYVYNLASKLLPCATTNTTSDSQFIVSAVDSAKRDEFLEIGFCDEGNLDTGTSSNRLCYIVDGSLSIFYSSVGTNTTTTTSYVSSRVNTTLQDIFESKELFSGLPPSILGSSLITPITNTPPTYSSSGGIARKIVSPTTVASFCAGLFVTVLLLHVYFSKRYHSRNNGTEYRNKRSDGDSSTPKQLFRHIRILSPRGGQKYVDLDDNVLPDSSGTTMASSLQASAFNFEPVLAATTSTESGSVSLFAVPPNDATAQPLQSPASSDSSCPFDDLHEDDSRSYGSVDLDCSVIGDGDLSTIYEEATFSHSVSF